MQAAATGEGSSLRSCTAAKEDHVDYGENCPDCGSDQCYGLCLPPENDPFLGDDVLVERIRALGLAVKCSSWPNDACASYEVARGQTPHGGLEDYLCKLYVDCKSREHRECQGERYALWFVHEDGTEAPLETTPPLCVTEDPDAVLAAIRGLM